MAYRPYTTWFVKKTNQEILLTFDKDQIARLNQKDITEAIDHLDAKGLHLLNSNHSPLAAKVYRTNKAFGVYKNHGMSKIKFANQIFAETEHEVNEHMKRTQPIKVVDSESLSDDSD